MIEEKCQTFRPRFWAGIIDGLVFLPLSLFDLWFYAQDYAGAVIYLYYAVSTLSIYVYSVFMHGHFGQTVGKMVMKVKVMTVSEERLGYGRALLRDSVIILWTIGFLLNEAPEILSGVNPYETSMEGTGAKILHSGSLIWFLAELITMLTNGKRRAVHDFISGSVVQRYP